LSFDAEGDATVHQAGGAQATFYPNGIGGYTAPGSVLGSLVQNSDGTFTLTEKGGDTDTFSARGQLLSEQDRNGYTTSLTYNSSEQLTTVTDPEGRTLTYAYGSNGLVSSVTDSSGRTVSYDYDSAGNLMSVTDANDDTTSFGYDSNHLLTTTTDPNGGTTTNAYDSSGRVTTQTDPAGLVTTLAYTGDNLSVAGGTTTVTDPHGEVTVEDYSSGELDSETKGSGTSDAATWLYQYGPTLNVTREQDPDGNVTTATYDSSGNVLSSTNALGTTTYTYNSFDEPLTVTKPPVTSGDTAGVTTAYAYDGDGNLQTKTVTGEGGSPVETTHYAYGDSYAGDVTQITDPAGHVTDYGYDQYGDVTAMTTHPGSGVSDTTGYVYNSIGELVCEASPNATADGVECPAAGGSRVADTTTWTYDADGDTTSVTDPRGKETDYVYDGDGNQTQVTDPAGNVTKTTYDADSRPLTVTKAYGTSIAATTTYAYDIAPGTGACTSGVTGALYCTTSTAPGGHTTVSWMNSRDEQIQQTAPESGTTTSTYDGDGNLSTQTTSGGTATYTYNGANQVTSIDYSDPGSGFSTTPNVTYTYDADGSRTQMTDGTGTTSYNYDPLERLSSVTNGAGQTVGYSYNSDNQLTQLTYPGASGQNVTYGYDGAGDETSLADWNGNESQFAYDSDGNLTTETLPNGVTDTYTYDNADNLTAIDDINGSTTVFSATYGVNDNGQVSGDSSQASGTSEYRYNALNQICYAGSSNTAACATPPTGADTYSYGAAGNLTNDNGTTQSFNAGDQLCWTYTGTSSNDCGSAPTGATTYTYDSDGNRTTTTPASGSAIAYTYNSADQLTQYQLGSSTPTSYSYDGDGLRESKTTGSTTTSYLWDESASTPPLLQETTGSNTTNYIYGPTGLPLEAILPSGATYYYAHDQLGSTRALTDSSGDVQDTDTYDPYGNLTTSTGTVPNNLLYAGQYQDAESGLYYMRARYYDPSTGQFLTVDPLVGETQQPYSYTAGDPVNATDPSGQDLLSNIGNAAAGILGGATGGLSNDALGVFGIHPDTCSSAYQDASHAGLAAAFFIPGDDLLAGAEFADDAVSAADDGASAIDQAASKVPDEWGPGQPARSGGGWRWSDPAEKPGTNYIRVDPGNPDSSDPLQQVDHVHVSSGGVQVANHLPLDQWLQWGSWNAP
jgi:RHS repeat-associated protein